MTTILILMFLSLATANINFCYGIFRKGCHESEREALLMFKQGLIDDANRLASWTHLDEDCCSWFGVVCNNVTSHVLELHLGNCQPFLDDYATNAEFEAIDMPKLRGEINPSLLQLKHLHYLDLSNNAFGGIPIPKFLGSIESLTYLNLSCAGFAGLVPHELGNLSSLQYLSLYADYDDDGYYNLYVANLQWLSGFPLLEYLDLGNVNLENASNWFQVLNTLPSLEKLYLSNCQLPQVIPSPTNLNLSSLAIPDLSVNSFENPSVGWIFHLNTLVSLDLSGNSLEGNIVQGLENMTSLRHLDLSYIFLNSSILDSLYNLKSLQFLNLGHNMLQGEISSAIGNMTSLRHLDLSSNSFNSSILDSLYNLKSLQFLNLGHNMLQGEISSAIGNMTSLRHLDLSSNSFNSSILDSLYNLKSLQFLNLGHNMLQGEISSAIGNMTSLRHLDLSYNAFSSSIPDSLYNLKSLQFVNLGWNNLNGEISSAIGNMTSAISLDFSWNFEIEGSIPRSMGKLCNLKSIRFSNVNLSQDVSDILEIFSGCVSKQLDSLDLSGCQLSGQLTNRLGNFKALKQLFLSYNFISGPIPESFGQLANLKSFYIDENLLEGVVSEIHFANLTRLKILAASRNMLILKLSHEWVPPFQLDTLKLSNWDVSSQFPLWFHSQKQLEYVDISNSTISDIIPSWFWNSIFQFYYLNLSHNQIHGQIPNIPNIANYLSTIDLSFNSLSGPLPHVSSNLSFLDLSNNFLSGSLNHLLRFNLNETMRMEVLNLGENFLTGEIPDCWMKWQYLKVIRLENNSLTGRIPSSMGSLNFLLSLKLRKNNIFGEVPLSLDNCTDLKFLDLGENELYGNITKWLVQGKRLLQLKVLSLHSNKFSGHIPDQLCRNVTRDDDGFGT